MKNMPFDLRLIDFVCFLVFCFTFGLIRIGMIVRDKNTGQLWDVGWNE